MRSTGRSIVLSWVSTPFAQVRTQAPGSVSTDLSAKSLVFTVDRARQKPS